MDPADGRAESTETPETETPAPEVAGGEEAPAAEASTEDEGFQSPLKIDSLPEDQREIATQLERQFKSAYTRARQTESEKVRGAEEALALAERLNDPETALDALNELAERHGFSSEDGDDEDEIPGDDEAPDEVEARLARLADAEEQRAEREAEEDRTRRVQVIHDHIEDGLESLAEELGVDEIGEDVAELVTYAALANPADTGLPDVERATEMVKSIQAQAVQDFLARKGGQKPGPDSSGSGSGISQEDLSTEQGRNEAADAIAARHFASA